MLIKLDDAIAAVENIVPEWARKGSMAKFNTVTIGQAEAALRALPTVSDGWEDISSAPVEVWVQGFYPDDPWANVWTVLKDAFGNWYGDHHSSKYATEREPPRKWRPLPAPPSE